MLIIIQLNIFLYTPLFSIYRFYIYKNYFFHYNERNFHLKECKNRWRRKVDYIDISNTKTNSDTYQ